MNETPEDLGQKIRDARARQEKSAPTPGAAKLQENTSSRKAIRAASDLVSAVVVGGFLGYWLDKWLDTKPLFMIIMFFLGFAAGFLNIYRAEMGKDYKIGFKEDVADKNVTEKKE